MFLLQKLSKLVENITCFTFSQLHTFQPIWLGLEIVDKGENKASVLDVLSRHTAELCGATSLKRTLCWASFLFNNFNQIHQQGKKCERRWEKWVCFEELEQFILLRTGSYSSTLCYAMIIYLFIYRLNFLSAINPIQTRVRWNIHIQINITNKSLNV